MKLTGGRIEFLDGLRGWAILMVIIWHCYGPTYADYLPFRDQFAIFPIRDFWVGVELFFLVSGFVITMTLERCDSLIQFGTRRWLRLFPAMLVTSILILAYDMIVGLGPHAQRSFVNLLPGLLFVSPAIIHTLTRFSIEAMDGTFWSLYVEVNFYAIFGALYYSFGLRAAIGLIFGISILACMMEYSASLGFGGILFGRVTAALDWIGLVHFGWFASGAFFFQYFRTQRAGFYFLAALSGTIAALDWRPDFFSLENRIALLVVVLLFALAVRSTHVQRFLSSRTLVFFGFVSYPLYLIHANVSVGLTELLGKRVPSLPNWLYPVAPISLMFAVAFVIAKYFEPAIRRRLEAWTKMLLAPSASNT
jgi:peptidoglycan/LPS O-acetylase OafA/YrhL